MDRLEDSLWASLKDSLEDSETNRVISEVRKSEKSERIVRRPGCPDEAGKDENETEIASTSVRALLEN